MTIALPVELERQLEAAKSDREALLAEVDRIRAMTPPGPQTDSADIVQQTREDTQNDWIMAQIDGGAYTNDSEVLRDLIREAQQESVEIEAIGAALSEGEKSGVNVRGPEDVRAAVKQRKSLNG